MDDHFAGIDIGGTTIKAALVATDGHIIWRQTVATPQTMPTLLTKITELVATMQAQKRLEAVGISAPGLVQPDGTMLTSGAITALSSHNLKAALQRQVQFPITVINDANAAAIAEQWLGAARGVHNYVCVALGTGVGGGIVINDRLYQGKNGGAGEFGWGLIPQCERLERPTKPLINYTASTINGLVRPYNAQVPLTMQTDDAREIIARAHSGDHVATHAVWQFVNEVAMLCIDLYAQWDPELLLIGGGISANATFMRLLAETVETRVAQHEGLRGVGMSNLGSLSACQLQNDAGLLGAVYTAIKEQSV